jgi:UDP-glucose:(heptosyl)LPS alpha-1,3-glucosyltransferase
MHIAIVRTVFDRHHGGAERYAVSLAQTWLGQGHRISIVCQRADVDDARGMDVITVPRPRVLGPLRHRVFARVAGQAAAATGADAVLCLARAWPGSVLRLGDGLHLQWMRERYGRGPRLRLAMLNPRHRELLALERRLFNPGMFRHYVANSELVRDLVVADYGVPADRIRVIPNGVDPERFHVGLRDEARVRLRRDCGIPEGAELVLFSGMDFRRKGLIHAVRAFCVLAKQRPKAWFACVGNGDIRPAGAILQQADLANRAVFSPAVENIAQWYAAADVFLLPTLHDPSANAVTESLACGTPVVTTAQNGAKQHIQEGVNGCVVADRENTGALAACAAKVLDGATAPADVARAANLLSTEDNAARLLDVLKQP